MQPKNKGKVEELSRLLGMTSGSLVREINVLNTVCNLLHLYDREGKNKCSYACAKLKNEKKTQN